MRRATAVAILFLTLLVFWISPGPLFAQTAKPPSLKEQLEAQYAPGTVLVIQRAGILGIPPASTRVCAAGYQDGNLKPPPVSCSAPLKNSSRPFPVGEKVNPSEIQVSLVQETISFGVVECDSCNQGNLSSSYKAQVDFQFAKGYLEKGRVSEIEDTISQLLSLDQTADQQSQPAQSGGDVLTNGDVVKMVKAKLGDGIIISTVKSSACNFDTSVNGMVKLKEAGVSDPVIQAMRDAQDASNAAANDQGSASKSEAQPDQTPGPPQVPGQLNFSVKHRHSVFWNPGTSDVEYYCSGTLSVTPDGTVAYECTQTDDPSGRCEHLSFAPGSLKQAKIALAGNLHLASKTQGNFDFYGKRDDFNKALAAIAPHVQK